MSIQLNFNQLNLIRACVNTSGFFYAGRYYSSGQDNQFSSFDPKMYI